jgi:hypothetical protein
VIQVLDGACPPTQVLACDDDGGCLNAAGSPGAVTICVTLGTTYTIRCAGWAGGTGTFYLSVTAVGPAVAPNDDCSTAIALAVGPNGPFTNAGATDSCSSASCGTSGSQGYHDIWFSYYAPCGGVVTVDTGCAPGAFDTVMTVYSSCGGTELACNDDCPSGSLGSSITFVAAIAGLYPIRVASWSAAVTGSFTVTVTQNPGLGLLYTSPFGPGSLQIDVVGGPPAGIYFLAVTFNQGAFPLGWFFGLDMTVAEISGLVNAGFPFVGPLDATCGGFTIGPIGGIGFLSGIPIYSVAIGIPPGIGVVPTGVSAPTTYTIP